MGHGSVAELLVEAVKQAGVTRIYGIAGDSLNAITDAVRRDEGMRWVDVPGAAAGCAVG